MRCAQGARDNTRTLQRASQWHPASSSSAPRLLVETAARHAALSMTRVRSAHPQSVTARHRRGGSEREAGGRTADVRLACTVARRSPYLAMASNQVRALPVQMQRLAWIAAVPRCGQSRDTVRRARGQHRHSPIISPFLNTYRRHRRFGMHASAGSDHFSCTPRYMLPCRSSLARAPDSPKFGFSTSIGSFSSSLRPVPTRKHTPRHGPAAQQHGSALRGQSTCARVHAATQAHAPVSVAVCAPSVATVVAITPQQGRNVLPTRPGRVGTRQRRPWPPHRWCTTSTTGTVTSRRSGAVGTTHWQCGCRRRVGGVRRWGHGWNGAWGRRRAEV